MTYLTYRRAKVGIRNRIKLIFLAFRSETFSRRKFVQVAIGSDEMPCPTRKEIASLLHPLLIEWTTYSATETISSRTQIYEVLGARLPRADFTEIQDVAEISLIASLETKSCLSLTSIHACVRFSKISLRCASDTNFGHRVASVEAINNLAISTANEKTIG